MAERLPDQRADRRGGHAPHPPAHRRRGGRRAAPGGRRARRRHRAVQQVRGATPLQAGLQLLPLTVFIPIGNIVFARISGRVAAGPLLTLSLLVAGAASLCLIALSPSTPWWLPAVALGATGVAGGLVAPAMTAALMDAAGTRHAGIAGSVLNADRQVGSLLGIASVGAVLAAAPGWATGTAVAFGLVGAAYLAGALVAWRLIRGVEAVPPPRPRSPVPLRRCGGAGRG